MSDTFNQTDFTEKTHAAIDQPANEVPVMLPPKKSNAPLIITLIIVTVVAIGSITYITLNSQKTETVVASPTPAPTEVPVETSSIRNEIAPYLQTIEISNPEKDEHPFPPVNFEVRIKDPNVR